MLTKLPDRVFVALLSKFILFGFITRLDFMYCIIFHFDEMHFRYVFNDCPFFLFPAGALVLPIIRV